MLSVTFSVYLGYRLDHDQLESLSYLGHCALSAFYYLCNLVFLCLCSVMYSSVEILFVNRAIKNGFWI